MMSSNTFFSLQRSGFLLNILFTFLLLFVIFGSFYYFKTLGQNVKTAVPLVYASSTADPCVNAGCGAGGYCGGNCGVSNPSGTSNYLYQCNSSKHMTSEEYCNYGCHTNSSGSDYCNSGSSATANTYNQCGNTTGACVWPIISTTHLVTVTQNAGNGNGGPATNGNWLCVDNGASTSCTPTSTPTPTLTPTPTPNLNYNCENGGPGGSSCNGWWDVDNSTSPGELGGVATYMTMQNIFGGSGSNGNTGIYGDYLYIVDHGTSTPRCLDGTGSDWIRIGFQNEGVAGNPGEHFIMEICPPNDHEHHYVGPFIPTGDYGKNAAFVIANTDGAGWNWNAFYNDQNGFTGGWTTDFSTLNGNPNYPLHPYAWRTGEMLTGTTGASIPGTYIHFTNNAWCPWSNAGYCGLGQNWFYYAGSTTTIQDDQSSAYPYSNYPLRANWATTPANSATGGDLEAYVDYQDPGITVTPTLTPTPVQSCAGSGGACATMTVNTCNANCYLGHSGACTRLNCGLGQLCCYNYPPTPTPTPTPSCQSLGGVCVSTSVCNNNCNVSSCGTPGCGAGQGCCL